MKVRTGFGFALGWAFLACAAGAGPKDRESLVLGYQLFLHEWEPNDYMSRAGDGLGPMFNERSCVGCHNQGGPGGAGPRSKNVLMLARLSRSSPAWLEEKLAEIHPGLRGSKTAIIHRFGVDSWYANWRSELLENKKLNLGLSKRFEEPGGPGVESVTFRLAQRNTPPVFGAGLIDKIPDEALKQAAEEQQQQGNAITGRLCLLPDGRIGRFGWKAQVSTLQEFVLAACAGELGLEVPGHHQTIDPLAPEYRPSGLDLTPADCELLIDYVRALPAPGTARTRTVKTAGIVSTGAKLFRDIGCASCHRPSLGNVEGLYSDLLLHDMGQSLGDPSQYYGDSSPGNSQLASAVEWRTPPLWGLRDSAPYLHDGRAETIDKAIVLHNGEGAQAAQRFKKLNKQERFLLRTFLASLAAPPAASLVPSPYFSRPQPRLANRPAVGIAP